MRSDLRLFGKQTSSQIKNSVAKANNFNGQKKCQFLNLHEVDRTVSAAIIECRR